MPAATRAMSQAVGEAITDWAWVEDGLVKVLRSLLGCRLEQAGIVWHSSVSLQPKLDMIDSLIAEGFADKPVGRVWRGLEKYVQDLAAKRNQIAHREMVVITTRFQPVGEERRPEKAELRPHAWDRTRRASRQSKVRYDLDEVEFAAREFNYVGGLLRELYLVLDGHIPWPDKFLSPLVRLQKTDGALPGQT